MNMQNEILEVSPGNWDSFIKALKKLSFLGAIQIYDGKMSVQIGTNSWLSVDFSGVLRNSNKTNNVGNKKVNVAFMNNHSVKELSNIPDDNKAIEVHEFENKYVFSNGNAYVSLNKYVGFNESHNIPDYKNNAVEMGTKSIIGKGKSKGKGKGKPKTLFKMTKNKGPIDLIVIKDELVAVRNRFGSRFPISKNTQSYILGTDPTSMYRSFSFDKFEGICVELGIYKINKGINSGCGLLDTLLHAEIDIDTSIKFNLYELIIPISKINWHN
jgi:hypothetical protein